MNLIGILILTIRIFQDLKLIMNKIFSINSFIQYEL